MVVSEGGLQRDPARSGLTHRVGWRHNGTRPTEKFTQRLGETPSDPVVRARSFKPDVESGHGGDLWPPGWTPGAGYLSPHELRSITTRAWLAVVLELIDTKTGIRPAQVKRYRMQSRRLDRFTMRSGHAPFDRDTVDMSEDTIRTCAESSAGLAKAHEPTRSLPGRRTRPALHRAAQAAEAQARLPRAQTVKAARVYAAQVSPEAAVVMAVGLRVPPQLPRSPRRLRPRSAPFMASCRVCRFVTQWPATFTPSTDCSRCCARSSRDESGEDDDVGLVGTGGRVVAAAGDEA